MWLNESRSSSCDFTNINGHYATQSIPKGTVIFTAEDAPDLELPRNSESNCELREMSDGELAVVAKRKIVAGEWFALSESEEEEEVMPHRQKRRRS